MKGYNVLTYIQIQNVKLSCLKKSTCSCTVIVGVFINLSL